MIANIREQILVISYRRWAGKTSYVHLAPEHVFTMKIKEDLNKISYIHVPGPQLNQQKPLNVFKAIEHVLN